jgi:hypothetical protein
MRICLDPVHKPRVSIDICIILEMFGHALRIPASSIQKTPPPGARWWWTAGGGKVGIAVGRRRRGGGQVFKRSAGGGSGRACGGRFARGPVIALQNERRGSSRPEVGALPCVTGSSRRAIRADESVRSGQSRSAAREQGRRPCHCARRTPIAPRFRVRLSFQNDVLRGEHTRAAIESGSRCVPPPFPTTRRP